MQEFQDVKHTREEDTFHVGLDIQPAKNSRNNLDQVRKKQPEEQVWSRNVWTMRKKMLIHLLLKKIKRTGLEETSQMARQDLRRRNQDSRLQVLAHKQDNQ